MLLHWHKYKGYPYHTCGCKCGMLLFCSHKKRSIKLAFKFKRSLKRLF